MDIVNRSRYFRIGSKMQLVELNSNQKLLSLNHYVATTIRET